MKNNINKITTAESPTKKVIRVDAIVRLRVVLMIVLFPIVLIILPFCIPFYKEDGK